MKLIDKISLQNSLYTKELASFCDQIEHLSLSEKLSLCQKINDSGKSIDFHKLFLLYLTNDESVQNEINRIIDWEFAVEKAKFLATQLKNTPEETSIKAINLIGTIGKKLSIKPLIDIFNTEDEELSKALLNAFNKIGDQSVANHIKKCLKSTNIEIISLAITILSNWKKTVSWKIFKPLIDHEVDQIRIKAAFAIAIRKNPKSAKTLLRAVDKEKNSKTRNTIIRYIGMIPYKKSISFLLDIIINDPDQKAKLEASRTLDRLQGLVGTNELYKLRKTNNKRLLGEIILRLGKFGCSNEKHVEYIRNTLRGTKDKLILQSSIQALGYIADKKDIRTIEKLLDRDPLISYTALIALTRMWYLEDRDSIYNVLEKHLQPITLQALLKYLIRRSGMGIDAKKLVSNISKRLEKESNLNVRYLSFLLLEFAPCEETIKYLLSTIEKTEDKFEKEAISQSLFGLSTNNSQIVIDYLEKSNINTLILFLKHLPRDINLDFLTNLAVPIFIKLESMLTSPEFEDVYPDIKELYLSSYPKAERLISILPNEKWQKYFLEKIIDIEDIKLTEKISPVLALYLTSSNADLQYLSVKTLKSLKTPSLVPKLIKVAETSKSENARDLSKNIIRYYVAEGVI